MPCTISPEEIFDSIQNLNLPRYEELPEIELYMDQVVALMQKYLEPLLGKGSDKTITPSMINNYVKQGAIPAPIKKRYGRDHIARLIIICIFKQILPIPSIQAMMKNYLSRCTVDQMYNRFRENYELLGGQTVDQARQRWDKLKRQGGSDDAARDDLVVQMAMSASVHKILIEASLDRMKSGTLSEKETLAEK